MISAQWKAVALLSGVFVLGAVTGVGGTLALQTTGRLDSHRFDPTRRGELSVQALTRRLDIDEGQRRKITEILDRHAPTRRRVMQEVMEQCGSAFREEKERLDQEIRAVLNPRQQARFDRNRGTSTRENVFSLGSSGEGSRWVRSRT
ncbi:MAG: hypothetical protein QM784_12835 [Polyangiaceae bacterium]